MSALSNPAVPFASFPDDSLVELSYVSRATHEMGLLSLMNLLEEAVHRNRQLGISGVLFFDSGVFGQILEGSPKNVEIIWSYITKDRRHDDVQVIAVQNISQRNFGNWSMKFFGSDEISQYVPELKTLLKGSYEKVPQELLLLMRSIASAQNEQGAGDSKPAA